jgi:hypothetical protein
MRAPVLIGAAAALLTWSNVAQAAESDTRLLRQLQETIRQQQQVLQQQAAQLQGQAEQIRQQADQLQKLQQQVSNLLHKAAEQPSDPVALTKPGTGFPATSPGSCCPG